MQNRRQRNDPHVTAVRAVPHKPGRVKVRHLLLGAFVLFAGLSMVTRGHAEKTTEASEAKIAGVTATIKKSEQVSFPVLDTDTFTVTQQKMLAFMKEEYAKQPASYDATVLTYTEGSKESWCADFISWVRFQADKPLINPETGYWRIPGVQSLRDYYASSDAFHVVGDYTPKFGDVAFYFGETPDGNNREHVAFVLGVDGDTLLTLGGNETAQGILQLRSNKLTEGERGLSGFGESNL